ncbi:MAG: cytochrome b/b6 domain-containing protein [Planctomycetes bacterium]|nr:cytochrome b/b6 domain-containing protein [Planctomycetota bacterium]MBI3845514.1 cytochrome b/b6 domain-containing protein [Planctomycetota bacterium]
MAGPWAALVRRSILLASFVVFASARVHAQTVESCIECHEDGFPVKSFKASAHGGLVCVACHAGYDPKKSPHEKAPKVQCVTCHEGAPAQHSFHPDLIKNAGKADDASPSCKDCHGTHEVVSPKNTNSKFHQAKLTATCGECHDDEAAHFSKSAHGQAAAANEAGAPNCLSCHLKGIVVAKEGRDVVQIRRNQARLCLSCHLDNPDVRTRTSPNAGFIAAYDESVHGKAMKEGNGKAAVCADCHGAHDMRKGSDPISKVNRSHVPETCGRCHVDEKKAYDRSIHARAAKNGVKEAPVCTDCHGEHDIRARSDPGSRTAAANVSAQVCSPCHSSKKLSDKFGLASDRFQTFSDSFHGLAVRSGSVSVANCASCHGFHDILPANDPESSVAKANLKVTCGKCHPGANERFALGSVHVDEANQEHPILFWIARIYMILIVTVIGGMVLHNALDFLAKARHRIRLRHVAGPAATVHSAHGGRTYLRMTRSERIQHGALLVSFALLVLTGFMLRYPEAAWVRAIRSLSDRVFAWRSVVHRVAALAMLAVGLYHIAYTLFTERGRQLLRDFTPGLRDLKDAFRQVGYNLGIKVKKPLYGRFSYAEKLEYWALVWGTFVMAVTGVVMWADNAFMNLIGKLGWDVARTIHFYEAWLAFLAILVWHIYFVVFNPNVYPMNTAWTRGTITEAEMEEEHPLELETLRVEESAIDAAAQDVTEPSTESSDDDDSIEPDPAVARRQP